jgi:hypothetical protein
MVSHHILRWYGKTWALAATFSFLLALIVACIATVKLAESIVQYFAFFRCSRAFDQTLECFDPAGYFNSWFLLQLTSESQFQDEITALKD